MGILQRLIELEPDLGVGVVPGVVELAMWQDRWLRVTEPPLPPTLVNT